MARPTGRDAPDRPGADAPLPVDAANLRDWLRKTRRLDRERWQRLRDATRSAPRLWTPRRVLRRLFPDLRAPVFLLGAPRSGTTFLGDALAALPEITYHFEPAVTKAAARYVVEGAWSDAFARRFYHRVYAMLVRARGAGDLRFAEKTPQNAFVVPFLARAFPDAQFVHIVRDGRDAALSYSQKPWLQATYKGSGRREDGGYPFGPVARFWVEPERRAEFEATSDLHRCAWAWRRHVESAMRDGRALPAGRYLEVAYERLVADPGAATNEGARILTFLGIADDASRAAFLRALAAGRPSSVGRWRGELSADDVACIEREAGPLLREIERLRDAPGA